LTNYIITSLDVNNITSFVGLLPASHLKTTEEMGSAHALGLPFADAAAAV
jgi:hypothetical protein